MRATIDPVSGWNLLGKKTGSWPKRTAEKCGDDIESDAAPAVWEVDLYRNGKYQVAIGAGKRFHVIDVLGREVKGFPKVGPTDFPRCGVRLR